MRRKGDRAVEKRLRGKVAALGAAVVLCAGGSLLESAPPETSRTIIPQNVNSSTLQTRGVQVYVSGAVVKPGIYEVPAGSRATEAIAAAGGMTAAANKEKVNLAKLLKDGMQVNVPRLSVKQLREQGLMEKVAGDLDGVVATETLPAVSKGKTGANASAKKVHLKTASVAELTALPGVGTVTAQNIVEYRLLHGFTSIEDLMQVKGIGKAKFAKMLPYLEL